MDQDKALIPSQTTGLAITPTTSNPVIRRMTDGLLAQARQGQLHQARFRIGDCILREPDYQQICLWAEAIAMPPEELLAVLADSYIEPPKGWEIEPIHFSLADGALQSLVWDFSRLPTFPDRWVEGLRLHTLGFTASGKAPPYDGLDLAPVVPRLHRLHLSSQQGLLYLIQPFSIRNLNLAGMPKLAVLECINIQLTDLDLSPVPGLTKLACNNNQLTDLDLSPVPSLTELYCWRNKLTYLGLSSVHRLTKLNCGGNQLTDLDLSPVPALTELSCSSNQLTDLDLSPVPGLTRLNCQGNQLTDLDLSPVPALTDLDCWDSELTELDLAPVPYLYTLRCDQHLIVQNAPPNLEIERE